jgi:hypothetical protein
MVLDNIIAEEWSQTPPLYHKTHKGNIKVTLTWINNLHVKAKIIKLLEETIGVNFCDLGLDNDSFRYDTKSTNKRKANKLDQNW